MSRIVVVEDDKMNALLFERILTRRAGFDVLVTEDADELMAAAKQGDVVLVVMDVSLSSTSYAGEKLDGIELTRILRRDPDTSHIPVMLATAHAMRGDREALLERSGASAYVSKPISDQQAFVDEVKELIANARPETQER